MKHRTKISIALIILAILGIAAYFIFSGTRYCWPACPDTDVNKDLVGPWKKYIIAVYGISFEHPESFIVKNRQFAPSVKSSYSITLNDPSGITYLSIDAYNGKLGPDINVGPFPKVSPPNEKNGTLTVRNRTINGINGYELYGVVDEGFGFADTFYFESNGIVYRVELNPVAEGLVDDYPGYDPKLVKEVYYRIRDSLVLNPK